MVIQLLPHTLQQATPHRLEITSQVPFDTGPLFSAYTCDHVIASSSPPLPPPLPICYLLGQWRSTPQPQILPVPGHAQYKSGLSLRPLNAQKIRAYHKQHTYLPCQILQATVVHHEATIAPLCPPPPFLTRLLSKKYTRIEGAPSSTEYASNLFLHIPLHLSPDTYPPACWVGTP